MIYEMVTRDENDSVRPFRYSLVLSEVLIVLALAPAALPLPPQKTQPPPKTASADDRVDINTASIDQLLKLPGMTRTWAARIVRFRPYRGKNELLDHGIVSSQVYDRIKDLIIAHRAVP